MRQFAETSAGAAVRNVARDLENCAKAVMEWHSDHVEGACRPMPALSLKIDAERRCFFGTCHSTRSPTTVFPEAQKPISAGA